MATDQTHGWNIWSITNLVAVRDPNMEEVGKCSHNTANVLEQRQTLRYRPEEQRTPWEHAHRDKCTHCKQSGHSYSDPRVLGAERVAMAHIQTGSYKQALAQGLQSTLSVHQSARLFQTFSTSNELIISLAMVSAAGQKLLSSGLLQLWQKSALIYENMALCSVDN